MEEIGPHGKRTKAVLRPFLSNISEQITDEGGGALAATSRASVENCGDYEQRFVLGCTTYLPEKSRSSGRGKLPVPDVVLPNLLRNRQRI